MQYYISAIYGNIWSHDEQKSVRLLRTVIPQFSLSEIEDIFTQSGKSKEPYEKFRQLFNSYLHKKDIKFPKSSEEFDNLEI